MPKGKRQGEPTKPRQAPKPAKDAKPPEQPQAEATAAPEPKKRGRPPAPPKAELTFEQWQSLFCQDLAAYENLLALEEEAKAEYESRKGRTREWLKEAKSDGFTLKDLKDGIALKADDGEEKARAEFERTMQIARWLELDVGHQASLFAATPDRTPILELKHRAGKRASLNGEPRRPPDAPGPDGMHDAWLSGYAAGQDILLSKFKAPAPEATDGQPTANEAPDGRPIGSVPVDPPAEVAEVGAEPITSGTAMSRSEWTEHMKRQADEVEAAMKAPVIGDQDPSYRLQ